MIVEFAPHRVSVWEESAIRGIESRVRRDLSAGYRYVAKMTPGVTPEGKEFAGRMLSIEPNHVALVVEGRVTGAMVGDSVPGVLLHVAFPEFDRLSRR